MARESRRIETAGQNELQLAVYNTPDHSIDFKLDGGGDTVWATQTQIAEAFGVAPNTVTEHLKNIFREGELVEDSVTRKFRATAKDGKNYNTLHYNLDAILSVGYRVSGPKATEFRKWATQTLRQYLEQGYVLNEAALRRNPEKLNELAAKVRALRSEERSVYGQVRECFKISASDYNPDSTEVRSFYALLQDKFHHAVTGMTGSKLIMDRADHTVENMGLHSFDGKSPTIKDATTGKNYLNDNELHRLHILSEQFLLFAEGTALSGKKMTMSSLHEQLDKLLVLNDYSVFEGYTDYLKDEADQHARREHKMFKVRQKVERAGLTYDPSDYELGEYDDILS
ncbi:MAG: RhuM family protein [Acetobacter papayae]|uniref:RhuM family protein n=1 Tax=Acetobacter papayae TaxID=1076592 RepID=UPI0039EB6EF0